MAEQITNNLEGYRVATTFRGLLHFPHSVDATLAQQVVYDGKGTATALSLGGDTKGATIHGNLTVSGSENIGADANIVGNINLLSGGNINDVMILSSGSTVNLRVPKTTEVGKLRIRESVDDYELLFGDPTVATPNLFSIIVKKNSGNNLYIKNNYNDLDIQSPLWINRSNGEVNIKTLNVVNIKTVLPYESVLPPGQEAYGPSNRSTIPIGMICMFPTLGIPSGWLTCDGTAHSKTSLPELFSIIGYNYNNVYPKSGDRFQVPDYRGIFIRGRDDRSPEDSMDPDAGRLLDGSVQSDEFKRHRHSGVFKKGNVNSVFETGGTGNYVEDGGSTYTEYEGSNNETRPKNVIAVYCIKW